MIHHEIIIKKLKKKKKLPNQRQASNRAVPDADNRASRSKNELLDRIVSNGDPTLSWMTILTLQLDRRTSTIATMRRTSTWWSFSACDRRSLPMISRLGSACEWLVCKWPVWVTNVSGRWVWDFCFEEEQKEEQIKKKRESKKSREERKKEKKREWPVGCDNAWLLGPTITSNLPTCHWNSVFEFWKQVKRVFNFGHSHPVLVTHIRDSKFIQTRIHPWDPQVLDHELRKLSDITQFYGFPSKL